MLTGAMPTIFVRDMDAAIRFYTEALGFELAARYGSQFASLDCGGGATIGLHPASATNLAGTVSIGFYATVPIREAAARLRAGGAAVSGDLVDDQELLLLNFRDADGTPLYATEMKSR